MKSEARDSERACFVAPRCRRKAKVKLGPTRWFRRDALRRVFNDKANYTPPTMAGNCSALTAGRIVVGRGLSWYARAPIYSGANSRS
jgi:hypothetical protein